MRESREVSRAVALRRHASAWVLLAALLALWLSQPVHPSLRTAATEAPQAATAMVRSAPPSHDPAHDAGACQLCRAAAQTRTSLRPAVHAGALAPTGPSSRFERPASALPTFDPVRDAWPRAPPTSRFVTDA